MPASPTPGGTSPAGRRRGRVGHAAMRFFNPSQIITLALALVLGGAGGAAAANGAPFILGKANSETSTATLSNAKGTPLSLSAPSGSTPLAVNRSTLVKNLNAQYLNGFTSGQLAVLGGEMYTPPNTDTPINATGKLMVTTGPLPAGIYYVTAAAELNLDPNDVNGTCWIATGSNPGEPGIIMGGGDQPPGGGAVQATETGPVTIAANDSIGEWCRSSGNNASIVEDAGITAIRVIASHTPPG
jgi:hypothetical protein